MFAHVNNDTEILIDIAKAHFLRQRPPGAKQTHFSYPSGHAAFAACTAILLSEMVPEKRGELFARSAIFAESRIIAGVHYPSDVEAGWISGTVVAQSLLMQPKFQADFKVAKAEVRSALGLPGRKQLSNGWTKMPARTVLVLRRPRDVLLQQPLPRTGRKGRRRPAARPVRMRSRGVPQGRLNLGWRGATYAK